MDILNSYIGELGIIYIIRDFIFGTPKYNYDRVVLEINTSFNKNICKSICRFRTRLCFGNLITIPQLVRQTHAICQTCNINSLSKYDHIVCFECAREDEHPIEFNYFHKDCI